MTDRIDVRFRQYKHEVLNPFLPDDDFDVAVRIAQAVYDQYQPYVVIGSSRGGAVVVKKWQSVGQ